MQVMKETAMRMSSNEEFQANPTRLLHVFILNYTELFLLLLLLLNFNLFKTDCFRLRLLDTPSKFPNLAKVTIT
jgi:hypothetical protein